MSYDQADLANRNNVEGVSKLGPRLGYKTGRARATLTATGGKAIGPYSLLGPDGNALVIPKGATITRAVYKVLTTFTSATDAATIALSVVAANDVVSAVAISTGTTWDASIPIVCIPVTATLSTWLHTTADSALTATVAVEALTAGKLVVFLEWLYWGDLTLT